MCGNRWSTKEWFVLGPIPGSKHVIEFHIDYKITKFTKWILYAKTTNLHEAKKILNEELKLGQYTSIRIQKITKITIKRLEGKHYDL